MKSPACHWLAWYKILFSYLTQWSRIFEQITVAWLIEKFPAFESSLLCSEEPAIGPCLEPNEFSSHPHILFFVHLLTFYFVYIDVKILLCIHDSALSSVVDFHHNIFFFP
jgi:hypothetical protein